MHISICKNVMRLFRVAMVTIACTLAMSGPTLAQDVTVPMGETRTTSIMVLTDGATVTNNGTIMTTGGTITTSGTGNLASGIMATGSDLTVTNAGTIMTSGADAHGINSAGNTNTGNTSPAGADAMLAP